MSLTELDKLRLSRSCHADPWCSWKQTTASLGSEQNEQRSISSQWRWNLRRCMLFVPGPGLEESRCGPLFLLTRCLPCIIMTDVISDKSANICVSIKQLLACPEKLSTPDSQSSVVYQRLHKSRILALAWVSFNEIHGDFTWFHRAYNNTARYYPVILTNDMDRKQPIIYRGTKVQNDYES